MRYVPLLAASMIMQYLNTRRVLLLLLLFLYYHIVLFITVHLSIQVLLSLSPLIMIWVNVHLIHLVDILIKALLIISLNRLLLSSMLRALQHWRWIYGHMLFEAKFTTLQGFLLELLMVGEAIGQVRGGALNFEDTLASLVRGTTICA